VLYLSFSSYLFSISRSMVTCYSIDLLRRCVDVKISSVICLINCFFTGKILFTSRFNLNATFIRSSYISMTIQARSQSCFSHFFWVASVLRAAFSYLILGIALNNFEWARSAARISCLTVARRNFSPIDPWAVSFSLLPSTVELIPQLCSLYAC
jgi:hypothetical protein